MNDVEARLSLSAETLGKFSIKESAPEPGLRAKLGEERRRGALGFVN